MAINLLHQYSRKNLKSEMKSHLSQISGWLSFVLGQSIREKVATTIVLAGMILFLGWFGSIALARIHNYQSHYYDLGIMHQVAYNSYQGFRTGDIGRVLEMTSTTSTEQVKRMAIHNDPILAILAIFYFIHSGPETLVILQILVIVSGAIPLYLLGRRYIQGSPELPAVLALSYLLYPPLQFTTVFDFHAVSLATGFLLWMFWAWDTGRYRFVLAFAVLSILCKEHVSLAVSGFFTSCLIAGALNHWQTHRSFSLFVTRKTGFMLILVLTGLVWFWLSLEVIIPQARSGSGHFALSYYQEYGDSPTGIVLSLLKQPSSILGYLEDPARIEYLKQVLTPSGLLWILGGIWFLGALPELGINLISSSQNTQNIIFHYNSLVTPFLWYATLRGSSLLYRLIIMWIHGLTSARYGLYLSIYLLSFVTVAFYQYGAFPGTSRSRADAFTRPSYEKIACYEDLTNRYQGTEIPISTTGVLAPYFSGRRYFYRFSDAYTAAEIVIVDLNDAMYGYGNEYSSPAYRALTVDSNYTLRSECAGVEVYGKIK